MHPSARLVDFTEAGTAGAGGVQAIGGALHDEFAVNSARAAKTWKTRRRPVRWCGAR
ncbi:hypothetical protein AB0D12_38665 [Streptomyces sp. NPDC048479]|uniref:hypothetical protein n=1 Tax=Streptomyces sp. NPDC048479 TaxID=3154725 RepID=UPI003417BF78